MRDLVASVFNKLIFPLITHSSTYLPGMMLVRMSRSMRKSFFHKEEGMRMKVVPFAGKLKMNVDRNSYMGGSIYWSGLHHVNELIYLNSFLKSGMLVIDVGANQGEFTIFCADKVKPGKVLSFEPVTPNRKLLYENIALNELKNVEVFAYGLSDVEGSLPIYTSKETELHSGRHEGLSSLYQTSTRNELEEVVELKVFDNVTGELPRIDFIKIDVEGAELFVLRGMKNHLVKYKPEILLEINDETFSAAGYTSTEVISFFEEINYVPYRIHRGRTMRVAMKDLHQWGNYIFRSESAT